VADLLDAESMIENRVFDEIAVGDIASLSRSASQMAVLIARRRAAAAQTAAGV
jgi:hypothetical protein